MARLAIFIDGGYIDKVARLDFDLRPDYGKLSEAIADEVRKKSVEGVDLFRTFYYNCPPYQSNPPTTEEATRFSRARAFHSALGRLPKYQVREGRLAFRGFNADGVPIFQQKRVDLLLGLDFALLAGKQQITHAALLSGDSDLIPAVTVAEAGRCLRLAGSWAAAVPNRQDLVRSRIVGCRRRTRRTRPALHGRDRLPGLTTSN